MDTHTNHPGALDDLLARAIAIVGLIGIALIHVLQLPDAFDDQGYLGALFICAAAGSLVLAAALTRTDDALAWELAAALPALILLGYVLSRSVGLPGFTSDIGEWSEPPGLASMVAEPLVIAVSVAVLATRRQAAARRAMAPGRPAVA